MSEAANAPAPEIQIIETREGRILRLQEEGQTMDLAVLWDATLGMVAPAISEADLAPQSRRGAPARTSVRATADSRSRCPARGTACAGAQPGGKAPATLDHQISTQALHQSLTWQIGPGYLNPRREA